MDTLLGSQTPTLIKINVEGWESEVLLGAEATLRQPSLIALIVEMNGQDPSLSVNEQSVHDRLLATGSRLTPTTIHALAHGIAIEAHGRLEYYLLKKHRKFEKQVGSGAAIPRQWKIDMISFVPQPVALEE